MFLNVLRVLVVFMIIALGNDSKDSSRSGRAEKKCFYRKVNTLNHITLEAGNLVVMFKLCNYSVDYL